ncbi:4-coumarate--CoA ligase-like 1 [Cytospora mali]|uniref:4-coumarate--CoA ligase-like 1 n=1 Tax=Cytospora mali TaxID=578113 RepID=A0A194V0D9_CYTMA|nr:4-coumarate--CoA ligase-like 1 [Valsa mali var. pyri (nom. inval.)]
MTTPAALASTSGTTGLPKVAVMSHYHYVAQSMQLYDSNDKSYEVWGLTEMGWITAFHYPEKDESGSVGRLLPGNEARIMNQHGEEEIEPRVQGEILVRGPSVMREYLDNPEATNSMLVNGWLHTGDIGYQLAGKWYIVDRAKDLIKVRGWQVSPAELEQCLLLHPQIHDAAVIGIDFNDGRGELPRVYIALREPTNPISDDEIRAFMNKRLSRYKTPDGGIVRIDRIPRSAAGKILKHILREMAAKETCLSN